MLALSPQFTPDQPVQDADWEIYLMETANLIVEQQSPKRHVNHCVLSDIPASWSVCVIRLLEVRGRIYELLTHCIPAHIIIKVGGQTHKHTACLFHFELHANFSDVYVDWLCLFYNWLTPIASGDIFSGVKLLTWLLWVSLDSKSHLQLCNPCSHAPSTNYLLCSVTVAVCRG